jgi:hypothetical protein
MGARQRLTKGTRGSGGGRYPDFELPIFADQAGVVTSGDRAFHAICAIQAV